VARRGSSRLQRCRGLAVVCLHHLVCLYPAQSISPPRRISSTGSWWSGTPKEGGMGNAHSDTKPHATKQQRHNPRPVAFMAQAHTPGEDNFYQRKSPGLVLFVCTSNTCRSPMAEFAARKWCFPDPWQPAPTFQLPHLPHLQPPPPPLPHRAPGPGSPLPRATAGSPSASESPRRS